MRRFSALLLPITLLCACDDAAPVEPDSTQEDRFLLIEPPPLENVAQFDHAALEAPESLLPLEDGRILVSLALTGEIRQINPDGSQETFATLPIGAPLVPCGGLVGILGALARDNHNNIYVNVASCNEEDRGVWKISPDGSSQERIVPFGFSELPNGIVHIGRSLLIADSSGGVWKAPDTGGTPELWADDELLDQSGKFVPGLPPGVPPLPVPGPNGIQVYGFAAYVANPSKSTIVKIPFRFNGEAGDPEVYHTFENLDDGCDDFAFDLLGRIYCTTDPAQTVIRIDRDGSERIVYEAEDGLDGPTAAAFGVADGDRQTLYISNAQFLFFDAISPQNGPSIQKAEWLIPGYPGR